MMILEVRSAVMENSYMQANFGDNRAQVLTVIEKKSLQFFFFFFSFFLFLPFFLVLSLLYYDFCSWGSCFFAFEITTLLFLIKS